MNSNSNAIDLVVDFRRQRAGSLDEDFEDLIGGGKSDLPSSGWQEPSNSVSSLFADAAASLQAKQESEDASRSFF